jgi:Na+(H+)/acetate symporter ActP
MIIGMIIVLLGVRCLGYVIAWAGQRDILALEIANSLDMAALSFVNFLGLRHRHSRSALHETEEHDH